MFNKKLVSVRIEPDVLKVIDEWVEGRVYYNRSDVINHLLRASVNAVLLKDGQLANQYANLYDLKLVIDNGKLGKV